MNRAFPRHIGNLKPVTTQKPPLRYEGRLWMLAWLNEKEVLLTSFNKRHLARFAKPVSLYSVNVDAAR